MTCFSNYINVNKGGGILPPPIYTFEIWKAIEGYEGVYEISNFGNVRSLGKTVINSLGVAHPYPPKTLALRDWKKYKKVILKHNGTSKGCFVHRLVASAFIPNPENKPCVNHKDFNPSNNCIENLEWVTHKENTQHAINGGVLRKRDKKNSWQNCHKAKLKLCDAYNIRKLNSSGVSMVELSRKYNVSHYCIWAVVRNKTWVII